MSALRVGDVLEKTRSGGRRKVKVLRVGKFSAILEDMAQTNQSRTNGVKTHAVNLGADGLPEGYRRAS
jgi:hypothetical protein